MFKQDLKTKLNKNNLDHLGHDLEEHRNKKQSQLMNRLYRYPTMLKPSLEKLKAVNSTISLKASAVGG